MIPLGSLPGEPPKPQLFCRAAASAVPSWSQLIRFQLAMDEDNWVPWCPFWAPTTQISTGRLRPGQRDMVKSPKIINEFSILACETCIKIEQIDMGMGQNPIPL